MKRLRNENLRRMIYGNGGPVAEIQRLSYAYIEDVMNVRQKVHRVNVSHEQNSKAQAKDNT